MSRKEGSSTFSIQEKATDLPTLLRANEIAQRIEELASEIRKDYSGKDLTIVVVLKGAFVFAADLLRALELPVQVEFIRSESYGEKMCTSGSPEITYEPMNIAERDVLVIEDIVDTGLTLAYIQKRLYELGARSVKLCSLLDKPPRRQVDLIIDYVGFVIPDIFVAGYGIDYAQQYRELRDICIVEGETAE